MANPQTTTPVMRRRLGGLLRTFRKESGMNLVQAAAVIGWESTRLSRVETGQYQIKAAEVRALLGAFKIDDPAALEELPHAAESGVRAWWAAYADILPRAYADSIALENEATKVRAYHPQMITAFLQTPAYAHAAISSSPSSTTQRNADSLVQVRQARRAILTRSASPVELDTVIDESVLYPRAGAAPDLMRDQLLSLLAMAERPNVTIRVMPLEAPAHPGLTSNMTILSFRAPWPPVVTIDHIRGGVFLDAPEDVHAFDAAFDRVMDAALSVEDSQKMIKQYAKGPVNA